MKPWKRFALAAVVVGVILASLSSFFYLNSQGKYSGKVEEMSIGLAGNEVDSLIYIAENQQYFASNGLNVTLKQYVSGAAAVNGVLDGEVNFAAAAEFVFVTKVLANESIRVFCAIDKFFNEYVVARTDKGINHIADLKGKQIGVSLGTSAEFYLGRFLELNGMNLSQVTLVNVPPPETPNALANGTLDAVIAWQPNINTIENLLCDKIVMWPAQGDQLQYRAVVCTDGWAKTHPELIVRFLNSLAQAENYVIHNPDDSKAIIQNRLNYSDAYIAEVWPENQFSLSLDQSLVVAMEYEARWLINNNLTSQTVVPDFLNYIYLEGLNSVKPESVNIIR